jgi:hypothetical protein
MACVHRRLKASSQPQNLGVLGTNQNSIRPELAACKSQSPRIGLISQGRYDVKEGVFCLLALTRNERDCAAPLNFLLLFGPFSFPPEARPKRP